jgi:precorrin-4/cobalt-precorrin-4 C11-methyltransferase
VRGARLLGAADVVVYAGSLVNPELLSLCRPGCEVHDSAGMTLEQTTEVLCSAAKAGKECVRLHTGDPALYGAIAEQMAELDRAGVPYDVVPGVSSLFGATAALRCELTRPGVTQSVVVTRAEGRTPVPERESLRAWAAHGATMALFLSAGLLEQAQEELLSGGYDPEAPAAIVYRATWPEEATYHCTVGTLAACACEHQVTRQALVVVGECLGALRERSRLYDPSFSHGYREATGQTRDEG